MLRRSFFGAALAAVAGLLGLGKVRAGGWRFGIRHRMQPFEDVETPTRYFVGRFESGWQPIRVPARPVVGAHWPVWSGRPHDCGHCPAAAFEKEKVQGCNVLRLTCTTCGRVLSRLQALPGGRVKRLTCPPSASTT